MTWNGSGANYLAWGAIDGPTGLQIDAEEPKIVHFESFFGTLAVLLRM